MIQKFTLESHHDRLLLQGLLVLPEQKPPRAVFQVAHGMCEHKERYLPFLQEMADHGYACVIPITVATAAVCVRRRIWDTFIRTAVRRWCPICTR